MITNFLKSKRNIHIILEFIVIIGIIIFFTKKNRNILSRLEKIEKENCEYKKLHDNYENTISKLFEKISELEYIIYNNTNGDINNDNINDKINYNTNSDINNDNINDNTNSDINNDNYLDNIISDELKELENVIEETCEEENDIDYSEIPELEEVENVIEEKVEEEKVEEEKVEEPIEEENDIDDSEMPELEDDIDDSEIPELEDINQ
tara:strand:+ start:180 stop:803 length:624 start_codon:yes stop_codon:yes gene_type:complete